VLQQDEFVCVLSSLEATQLIFINNNNSSQFYEFEMYSDLFSAPRSFRVRSATNKRLQI